MDYADLEVEVIKEAQVSLKRLVKFSTLQIERPESVEK